MKNIKNDIINPIEISEKEFVNQIRGCKKVLLTDYNKELIFSEVDEEGNTIEIVEVKGYFQVEIKTITKKPKDDDNSSILKEILKKLNIMDQRLINVEKDVSVLKEDVSDIKVRVKNLEQDVTVLKEDVTVLKKDVADIKVRVGNLEKDVSVLKQDVADIKRCPTIQKELSQI